MIKSAARSEFRNLLAAVRLAVLADKANIIFPKKKYKYLELMSILVNEGFIEGFEERGVLLILHLKHTHWKTSSAPMSAFTDIKALTRLHRRDTYSYSDIAKLQRLDGHAQCILISTDRGILTGNEAAGNIVGGIPLFKIK